MKSKKTVINPTSAYKTNNEHTCNKTKLYSSKLGVILFNSFKRLSGVECYDKWL